MLSMVCFDATPKYQSWSRNPKYVCAEISKHCCHHAVGIVLNNWWLLCWAALSTKTECDGLSGWMESCHYILFYSRLCSSSTGSSPPPESSIFLCLLLSSSIPLPVAPQCHLSNDVLVVTYSKISHEMVNHTDIARNAKDEGQPYYCKQTAQGQLVNTKIHAQFQQYNLRVEVFVINRSGSHWSVAFHLFALLNLFYWLFNWAKENVFYLLRTILGWYLLLFYQFRFCGECVGRWGSSWVL